MNCLIIYAMTFGNVQERRRSMLEDRLGSLYTTEPQIYMGGTTGDRWIIFFDERILAKR